MLTLGDPIFSKLDFMTDTRRPRLCESDYFSGFFSIALAFCVLF